MEAHLKKCIEALDNIIKGHFVSPVPEDVENPILAELSQKINSVGNLHQTALDEAMEMALVLSSYMEELKKITKGDFKARVATDSKIEILNVFGSALNNTFQNLEKMQEIEKLLREVSTPCLKLWEEIVAMPLIGAMTSKRAKEAMENILKKIVEESARVAIVDVTGVPVVDTMVADYLIKTMKAIKILGAEPVITGIGPEVASTLVSLGIEIGDFVTKSSLAEGLKYALEFTGKTKKGNGEK